MKEGFDKAWLEGLKFTSSKPQKEGGHQRTERALREEDVLDFSDKGTTVVLVTADGRKHTVEKKVKK